MLVRSLIERSEYPTLEECVYLNQASLGLISRRTIQSMHAFLDDVARHGNFRMTDSQEVAFSDALREKGSRLLNCDVERVAILSSAGELLGQLPFLIRPGATSNVVMVSTDFPAITRPWLRYSIEESCPIRFVEDIPTEGLTERIVASIDADTAVVAVSFVQFASGSRIDIPRLRQATARVGARLIVDVTQAAGTLKIDSKTWEADVVVSSGYKWLGGHGGIALAALSLDLLEMIPPLPGWMGARNPFDFDATQLSSAEGARRYTQSTMSYVSMVGLTTALDQLQELDADLVEPHAARLSEPLIEQAQKSGWKPFRSFGDPSASPHIVTLSNPERDAERTVEILRDHGIICSNRDGRIRVSIAPYNNSDDIDALTDVLALIMAGKF